MTVGKARMLTSEARVLLELVRLGGRARAIELEKNIPPSTLYRALRELIIVGYVRKTPEGFYELTGQGLEELRKLAKNINSILSRNEVVVGRP